MATQHDPPYLVGRSDHETMRLLRQAQVYGPLTRRLLTEAGVGLGMHVLEVGSGAGDVALILADLVGPVGHVLGIDSNPRILQLARNRVEGAGWKNIVFHDGDIRTASIDGLFDAVVGRFVLGWVRDRPELLRACIARVRPGGLVVFQEHDALTFYVAVPASPTLDQWRSWAHRLLEVGGIDPAFALNLYGDFCAAGLRSPQMRYEVPIGGGPQWTGYEMLADQARSVHDFMIENGIATDEEMQIETLAARLRAEVVRNNGVLHTLPALGIWARK
jgi:ubiquinone/menaquinone biosynthesis C-methylase UbiE